MPTFQRLEIDQFVLEHSTPRAGEIEIVGRALAGREIGLGVVNPRTDEVESPAAIVARVEEALRWFPPDRIFLNPDCGFGCFANRCVNDEDRATAKTRSMAEATAMLRSRSGTRREAGRSQPPQ